MAEADLKRKISIHIFGDSEFTVEIFELIAVIKSFQLPIKIDNNSKEEPTYNFEIIRDDSDVPFSTKTGNSRKAIINADFYYKTNIKVPFVNYLLYCFVLSLLELELKNKKNKKNIDLFLNYEIDNFDIDLFYGRYHNIVNRYLYEIVKESISKQLSEKVTKQLQVYYQRINSKNELFKTYLFDENIHDTIITSNLLEILAQTDEKDIDSTLNAFDAHDKEKWYKLINLIAQSSSRRKMEMLNYFLYKSKIDIAIKVHFEYLLYFDSEVKKDWNIISNFLLEEYDTDLSEKAIKALIEINLVQDYDTESFKNLIEQLETDDENAISDLLNFINSSNNSQKEILLSELDQEALLEKENDKRIKRAIKGDDEREGGGGFSFTGEEPEKAEIGRMPLSNENEKPEDALNYKKYAEALASVIADKNTSTPLTIGVCAPWGMGKTVLMNFIEDELVLIKEKINSSENKDESIKLPCDVIKINAWEISKAGTIWEEFYVQILTEFEKKLDWCEKVKFRVKLLWNTSITKRLFFFIVVPFLFVLIIILYFSNQSEIHEYIKTTTLFDFKNIPIVLGALTLLSPVLIAIWKFTKSYWSDFFKSISRHKKEKNINELDTLHNIKTVKNSINKIKMNRIIVLVDDLDRCDYKNILNILESMRLFLDIPNFVFILGMDTKVVRHAVGQHYKFMCNDKENNHEQENMGRSYLEKIIQIPFHLPRLSPEQKKELNKQILKDYTDFKESIVVKPPPAEVGTETIGPQVITKDAGKDVYEKKIKKTKPIVVQKPKKQNQEDVLAKLTTQEYIWIRDLQDNDAFDISPRLINRFINIYLIARHMYISEFNKQPDFNFINWLALSVNFPFEAKALLKWMEEHNWKDPIDLSTEDLAWEIDNNKIIDGLTKKIITQQRDEFPYQNNDDTELDKFTELYILLQLDFTEIRQTTHITNCFNLILD